MAVAVGVPAEAQHHARLSGDIVSNLASGALHVEVIVDDAAKAGRLAARYNLKIKRQLKSGAVLDVNAGQLAALQTDGEVDHLSGNALYHTSGLAVDPVDEGIGVDQVWAGVGALPKLSGKGVGIAVIDSGMDLNHWALKGQVAATVDFTGGNGGDGFGHGTHVAAIIAGRAGKSNDTRMYRGVAYGASLINLRVLGDNGTGSAANLIEAIDWAIDHQRQYNIRVINLSLGSPVRQSYKDDPVCAAVERAVRAGIVVVAAAGNHGTDASGKLVSGAIESPGNSPYALTVGALDAKGTADRSDDEVATFSANGPTAFDHVLKPNLVAPGRRITSAEAAGSLLSTSFPLQHVAGSGNDSYIYGSGTSMATAFVSGAAALLFEERPALSPIGAVAALELSSSFMKGTGLVRSGAGSLNVVAASEFVVVEHFRLFSSGVVTARRLARKTDDARFDSDGDTLVWGNGDTLVWGNGDTLVWGNGDTLVWGNGDTLVWGNADTLVWGNGDTLVWGNGDTLVWGNGDTLVWGNGDTLVWGNGDTLVWGNGDTLVWGNGDTLVWGNGDTLVWGNADTLVWGN